MQNDNFIVITGYMINELKLKGNELLIYAIIHGFSQCENQKYTAGIKYLMECTCASKQTVISTLQSLYDKGFIEKEEEIINNVKFVYYWSKNLTTRQEILPNNIRDSVSVLENNLYSSLDTEKEKKNIKRKEKLQTSIVTIFNFWNAKNIIVHRDLTAEREKAIEQAITTYGENDVMTAIDRYAKAYHDKEFKTCEYAWDLVKFLKQKNALPDFLDDGSKWCNYLSFLSNSKPTTPIKRQRLTYEATEEDIEEYDRRFKI